MWSGCLNPKKSGRIEDDFDNNVRIRIPRDTNAGQQFSVRLKEHELVFRCPRPKPQDGTMIYDPTKILSVKYEVTIPHGTSPGDIFYASVLHSRVIMLCPNNRRPGQTITLTISAAHFELVRIDLPFDITLPATAPRRSFGPFYFILSLDILNVPVVCPPPVRRGDIVRIVLPIVFPNLPGVTAAISTPSTPHTGISQDSEPSRMIYNDCNGWTRVAVGDANLKWVYIPSTTSLQQRLDIAKNAFVRELTPLPLHLIPALHYSISARVPNVELTLDELVQASNLNFNEKVTWWRRKLGQLAIPWTQGRINIRVIRQTILQDSIDEFHRLNAQDMRRQFYFNFINEEGVDAGGLARDWFTVVSQQLFNPNFALFLTSITQDCVEINPAARVSHPEPLQFYYFAGRFLGKALFDNQITAVKLSPVIYKHLLGYPLTLYDLQHLDMDIYRNMLRLTEMPDVSEMTLDFTVTESYFDTNTSVELIPDGGNIDVTNDNVGHYLGCQLRYRMLDSIRSQLSELLRGFYEIIPEPLLSIFDMSELQLLLHGQSKIDMDDWRRHTEYTGLFSNDNNRQVVEWFWDIVASCSYEDKIKLLHFSTGTTGVPAMGFEYLQGNGGNIRKFTLNGVEGQSVFPHAHTCFNRLDMPIYRSKEEAERRIMTAIRETSGFGIV